MTTTVPPTGNRRPRQHAVAVGRNQRHWNHRRLNPRRCVGPGWANALTLDPHSQNEGPTHTLNHHIYETLVGRATDGTLTPRLATEVGRSAEERRYRLGLQDPRGCHVPRGTGIHRRGRGLLARPLRARRPRAWPRFMPRWTSVDGRRQYHRAREDDGSVAALRSEPDQHLHHVEGMGRGQRRGDRAELRRGRRGLLGAQRQRHRPLPAGFLATPRSAPCSRCSRAIGTRRRP